MERMLPVLGFDNSLAPDFAGINSRCITPHPVLHLLVKMCCEKKTNYKTMHH